MKRFLSFLLTLVLVISICSSVALAEDFSTRSDSDLYAIYNSVRNELVSRSLRAEDKTILLDENGVQIYINGDITVEESWLGKVLSVPVVIINNTAKNLTISLRNASVNGWSCDTVGAPELPAGKKVKETYKFELDETDVESLNDFEDVEFIFHIYDSDDWMADSIDTGIISIYK